jgi:hypothetical protein
MTTGKLRSRNPWDRGPPARPSQPRPRVPGHTIQEKEGR